MSYDLFFWPAGATDEPCPLADRLADEEADGLVGDGRVLAFRAELLRRWPDLADMIAPWYHDLGWRQPWGRIELADRFVGLTLPFRWKDTAELPALANAYGLDCYDGQADELLRAVPGSEPGPRPSDPPTHRDEGGSVDAVSSVRGWVNEDNVVRSMELISAQIGYSYDDLDEAALTGALDGTNDESADGWFQYPLEGVPPLMVHLARSPGDMVVIVRVEGDMDAVLAARIETLLDML